MTFLAIILLQASYIASFLGGAFEGTAETLKFHYYKFEKHFPNANDNYWDSNKSWLNKYQNNQYGQGQKYFGSTTFLAWTTDGYHLMRTARNASFMAAIVLKKHKKQKWYWYLAEGAGHLLAYQAGFHLTYSVIYR